MRAQIQAARAARKSIERIRKELLCPTPEAVGACAQPLTEAIKCMEVLQTHLGGIRARPGDPTRELTNEIWRLRKELGQVNALLRSAAEFHEGYGQLLRCLEVSGIDYTRQGSAVRPPEVRKLIVHG